ncbi:hypothetical protein B0O80DRAFT_100317 [Mortierella sp. GBAus27b]|nr:hypothetical protein B0O80DRAFT_100317 [Mortierella sp. GBAus27b]
MLHGPLTKRERFSKLRRVLNRHVKWMVRLDRAMATSCLKTTPAMPTLPMPTTFLQRTDDEFLHEHQDPAHDHGAHMCSCKEMEKLIEYEDDTHSHLYYKPAVLSHYGLGHIESFYGVDRGVCLAALLDPLEKVKESHSGRLYLLEQARGTNGSFAINPTISFSFPINVLNNLPPIHRHSSHLLHFLPTNKFTWAHTAQIRKDG